MKKVIVPVGLPGSGKTSWIREHRQDIVAPSVVISGDEIRLMLCMGEYSFSGGDTDRIICSMIEMAKTFLTEYQIVYLDEYYLSYNDQSRVNTKFLLEDDHTEVTFHNIFSDLGKCIHRRCTDKRESDTSRWPNVLIAMSKDFEPVAP